MEGAPEKKFLIILIPKCTSRNQFCIPTCRNWGVQLCAAPWMQQGLKNSQGRLGPGLIQSYHIARSEWPWVYIFKNMLPAKVSVQCEQFLMELQAKLLLICQKPSSPVYSQAHVCLQQVFSSSFYLSQLSLRTVKTNPKDSSPCPSVSAGVIFALPAEHHHSRFLSLTSERGRITCKLLLRTTQTLWNRGSTALWLLFYSVLAFPQNKYHRIMHNTRKYVHRS